MPLELQNEELRGQQLSRHAIELLAKQRAIGTPIHYREWFTLVPSHQSRAGSSDEAKWYCSI
jgi:hypothetical protein